MICLLVCVCISYSLPGLGTSLCICLINVCFPIILVCYVVLCTNLQAGAIAGDGYAAGGDREPSPHTKYEMFEGLTVMRAAQVGTNI